VNHAVLQRITSILIAINSDIMLNVVMTIRTITSSEIKPYNGTGEILKVFGRVTYTFQKHIGLGNGIPIKLATLQQSKYRRYFIHEAIKIAHFA
jgi:hypothetical protein